MAVAVEYVAHRKKKQYDPMSPPQLPTFGTVPILPHTFQIVLRLSRPRTWTFAASSFILGYTLAGGSSLFQMALGLAVAGLVTAATNVVNAFADRKEDAVNQPSRVFWIDQIGLSGTITSLLVLYGMAIAASILLGPLFMLVLAVGIFNSIFYSVRPLRFKARPLASLVSFSGAVGLSFLSGLSVLGSVNLLNPVFLLLTYFMFTYGTVKNLPDYSGDKKAGTRTSATIFHSLANAVRFSGIILFTPYILLTVFIAAGALAPIYLADLGMGLIFAVIFSGMLKAKSSQELEKAHTFGFFYAISFILFTLVLTSPTLASIIVILSAYLWTLLVSRVSLDSRVENRDWEKPRRKKT
jgi:4-hydroxybenzoate polyprenyltransferase